MADAVTTNVVYNGNRRYVVQLLNTCDGTGESAVVKIDISSLIGVNGVAPDHLAIEEIQWNIQGFTKVALLFDADTDDEAFELNGNGYKDFRDYGNLVDPKTTGYTGDLLLTTAGNTAGDSYDIVISAKLK